MLLNAWEETLRTEVEKKTTTIKRKAMAWDCYLFFNQ